MLFSLFGLLYRKALPYKKQKPKKKIIIIETVIHIMPSESFQKWSKQYLFQTVVMYEGMYFWQHWRMSFSKGVANTLAYILANTVIESCMTNISFIVQQTVEFIYKIKTAVPCQTTRWEQIIIETFICEHYLSFFPPTQKGIQLNAGFSIEAAEWVIKQ